MPIGLENWLKLESLPLGPNFFKWSLGFILTSLFIFILMALAGYSPQVSAIYSALSFISLSALGFLFVQIITGCPPIGCLVGTIDMGNKKEAWFYPLVSIMILILLFWSSAFLQGLSKIRMPSAAVYPFLFSISIGDLTSGLVFVDLVGVEIAVIEEMVMAFIAGIAANYFIKDKNIFSRIVKVTLVVLFAFVVLHIPTYYSSLSIAYEQYQTNLPLQDKAPKACAQGDYYDFKLNTCLPTPASPNTNQFYWLLFIQLLTLSVLRISLTFANVVFNSQWIGIMTHSLWNIIISSVLLLGVPIYAVIGILTLSLLFIIWYAFEE